MRPTPDEIRAHAARWPTANGGGLWRQRLYGTTYHPVRLLEIQPGHEEGTPLAFDERTEWTPCTPDGDPVPLVEERDYYRDQHDKMRAQRDEYRRQRDAAEVVAQRAEQERSYWMDASIAAKAAARETCQHIESLQVTVAAFRQERDELQQQVCDLASQLSALRQKLCNAM